MARCPDIFTNSFSCLDALIYLSDERNTYSVFARVTGEYAT